MQLQRSVGSLQQFWFQLKFSASDFAAVSAFRERPAPVLAPASAFSEQLCSFSSFSVGTTAAAALASALQQQQQRQSASRANAVATMSLALFAATDP